jgi:hypothetical protein
MKKILLLLFFNIFISLSLYSQVYVSGYTKKNGTYVEPHYRSSPNSNPNDNYSFPGNTNPYTGKTSTGNPDTYLENYNNRRSRNRNYGSSSNNNTFPNYNQINNSSSNSYSTSPYKNYSNNTSNQTDNKKEFNNSNSDKDIQLNKFLKTYEKNKTPTY